MASKTFKVLTKNNEELLGNKWVVKNPKANIVVFVGMEETSMRYDEFSNALNENGYNVFIVDYYGQGLNVSSDFKNRGIWPKYGFNTYMEAIHNFVLLLKEDKLPVYVFSHSMGSFFSQGYMIAYPNEIDKYCLCGAGAKNSAVGLGYFLANITTQEKTRNNKSHLVANMMFGNFNKKIKNPETSFDWLSYDKENVIKYIDDPLCGFGSNKGFCLEFLRFMKTLWTKESLSKVSKENKILLISGLEDPVTNYTKGTYQLQKMYKDLGVNDVTVIIYKNARHEILNEVDSVKKQVIKDIINFYNK